ncbi:MAG: SPFH domain-containing protein, partial [Segetibacter sp.]
MLLIILGLAAFFAAGSLQKMQSPLPGYTGTVRIIASVLIVIGILTSCLVQIDAGQIGVQTLFGKVENEVLNSGLHFINPLVSVNRIDVRTENYTMSGVHDEGDKSGDDAIRVLTSDGLEVIIDLTVLYHVQASEA